MDNGDSHRITNLAQLRGVIEEPSQLVYKKILGELDEPAMDFIRRSPFLVLSTADAEGHQDASPKGGDPGFVAIANAGTLLIPDRKGNKLVFTLQNILTNPHVGILFMIPGTEETLRVNGTVELTVDPAILEQVTARGAVAHLALRVTINECFFHCAKAFMRSQLWRPESWQEPIKIAWGEYLASKMGAGKDTAKQIDAFVDQDYKTNL